MGHPRSPSGFRGHPKRPCAARFSSQMLLHQEQHGIQLLGRLVEHLGPHPHQSTAAVAVEISAGTGIITHDIPAPVQAPPAGSCRSVRHPYPLPASPHLLTRQILWLLLRRASRQNRRAPSSGNTTVSGHLHRPVSQLRREYVIFFISAPPHSEPIAAHRIRAIKSKIAISSTSLSRPLPEGAVGSADWGSAPAYVQWRRCPE